MDEFPKLARNLNFGKWHFSGIFALPQAWESPSVFVAVSRQSFLV